MLVCVVGFLQRSCCTNAPQKDTPVDHIIPEGERLSYPRPLPPREKRPARDELGGIVTGEYTEPYLIAQQLPDKDIFTPVVLSH